MPCNYRLYPRDWPAISLRIRQRDGWRCAWCGAENGKPNPRTGSKVVLTVAHLGVPDGDRPGNKHDKHDVRDENLAALCNACHLAYDHADHVQHARETRWRKRHIGMGMLPFAEPLPGLDRSSSRTAATGSN